MLLSYVRLFATPWTKQSMEFSRPEYWSGEPLPSPGDLPNPGIEPRSPALQADSLPAEPQGKPKNTGVGSLSLLQGIFPTQESNRGLLCCRQILYQLSYQGSPFSSLTEAENHGNKATKTLHKVHDEPPHIHTPETCPPPGGGTRWQTEAAPPSGSQPQKRSCDGKHLRDSGAGWG